ncbi:hypothetical protein Ancab_018682, partial [Ancistrocladus abbreviatus]
SKFSQRAGEGGQGGASLHGGLRQRDVSFADAVRSSEKRGLVKDQHASGQLPIPQRCSLIMDSKPTDYEWLTGSYTGVLKPRCPLLNMTPQKFCEAVPQCRIRYLGGRMVLLTAEGESDLANIIANNGDTFSAWRVESFTVLVLVVFWFQVGGEVEVVVSILVCTGLLQKLDAGGLFKPGPMVFLFPGAAVHDVTFCCCVVAGSGCSLCMQRTLERYQRCSYGSLETSQPSKEAGSSYQEYLKLKAKVDVLQRAQKNLLGEDLGELGMQELEQLEHQLDKTLRRIKSSKWWDVGWLSLGCWLVFCFLFGSSSLACLDELQGTQFMLDQLTDLQQKEEVLLESNVALKRQLEKSSAMFRSPPDTAPQNIQCGRQAGGQPEVFFELLQCNSNTLQVSFNPAVGEPMNETTSAQNINGFGAGWML